MEEELRKKQEQDEEQVGYGSEERGPVLPEGRAGGRREETARQLIRRAKQARRSSPRQSGVAKTSKGRRYGHTWSRCHRCHAYRQFIATR
jgi:hypothetical protein